MENLSAVSTLVVCQQKEWGEIATGFETKNRYTVSDGSGNTLYVAAEEPGSTMLRLFLKALRPFTIAVLNNDGQPVLRVTRPFRFYFHRAEITDRQGRSLGVIERRFSIARRIYAVSDTSGDEIFQLFGPILHPWTFEIRNAGVEYGKITKK